MLFKITVVSLTQPACDHSIIYFLQLHISLLQKYKNLQVASYHSYSVQCYDFHLLKVYIHTFPCGLGIWPYASNQHFTQSHLNFTHFLTTKCTTGRGIYGTHYTCSPACMQHAYNDIRLHNTKLHIWQMYHIQLCCALLKSPWQHMKLDLIAQIAM